MVDKITVSQNVAKLRSAGCVRFIALAAVIVPACCGRLHAQTREGQKDSEPTVTREEAALLERIAEVSATNINAAAALLAAEVSEDTGAAIDFTLGNLYFQSEQFDSAATAYRRVLEKMPRFRRARLNLSRIYLLQEKPAEAVRLLQYLVLSGQPDMDGLVLLGHAFALEEHPVSAENAYRQALLLDAGNTDALVGLIQSLMNQSRYREGVNLLDELLQQQPGRRELWSLSASARLALAEQDKALAALETARRLGIADNEMLATLGDLYLNSNQPDDAASAFKEVIKNPDPPPERLLRAAEAFLLADEWRHAGEMIRQVEELRGASPDSLNPDQNTQLLRLKGNLARLQGRREAAVEIYSQLLGIDPLDARTLIMLGDLHRESGALEEALMSYERAGRISGHEAEALVCQAQIEVERARYPRAVELLETAQAFRDQPHVARYLEQVRRLAR